MALTTALQRWREFLASLDPLVEETLFAGLAMALLGGAIALGFWLYTGISPWPMVALAELAGFAFGVSLLALASPRRRRR